MVKTTIFFLSLLAMSYCHLEEKSTALKPRNDEGENPEEPPEDNPPNPGPGREQQPSNRCSGEGRCCFQFTWTGSVAEEDIPAPVNNTCKFLRESRGDDSFACYDPIVYTEPAAGNSELYGTAPNITALKDLSDKLDYKVYCIPRSTDQPCVKFSYIRRNSERSVINETRFCGDVTDVTSGGSLQSGCYREYTEGYIREVCACQDYLCNSSSPYKPSVVIVAAIVGYRIAAVLKDLQCFL